MKGKVKIMEEKIYVIVRNYECDGTSIVCFKNEEDARAHAIQMAKEDHDYFEFEDEFEECCFDWKRKGITLHADGSVELWGYECKNVTIELLEATLQ